MLTTMMRRFTVLVCLLLLHAIPALAQFDIFGGRTDVSCPDKQAHQVTATCSQGGTTSISCTVPTGDGVNYGFQEPIYLSGSGTALDTTASKTLADAGADIINVVPSGDTFTLTANSTATVSAHTLTFTPARFYIDTVNTPFGIGPQICTPQNHWVWAEMISDACASLVNGQSNCAFNINAPLSMTVSNATWVSGVATLTVSPQQALVGEPLVISGINPSGYNCSPTCVITAKASTTISYAVASNPGTYVSGGTVGGVSQTGGVVTYVAASGNSHTTLGMNLTITGCADPTYNVSPAPVTSIPNNNTFTYNATTTNPTTTGCGGTGFGWSPPKYSGSQLSRCNSAGPMASRYRAMGFQFTGDDTFDSFIPFGASGCAAPSDGWLNMFTPVTAPAFSRYPSNNLWGCGSQPIHVPDLTIDRAVTGITGEHLLDWFDPAWPAALPCLFGPVAGHSGVNFAQSPFLLGQTPDDSDSMVEFRGGPWWHSVPVGKNAPNPALLVLASAPQISFSDRALYPSPNSNGCSGANCYGPWLFPVMNVWAKTLSTTPPASCSDAAPCSLPDFLRNKYATCAAFNAAWGATYDATNCFGSTQSVFTGETITTPASYTLAHSNVTPRSVQFYLTPSGGAAFNMAGDCDNAATDCPTGTAGQGTFMSIAPCKLSANYFSTGIPCVDSNGDIEKVTTAGTSGAAWTFPATNSCSGTQTSTSGTVTATCIGPQVTGTIAYSTGVLTLTIGGAGSLPSGETLTASYTTGGFKAGGNGVMDEDGGHSWMPSNGSGGLNGVCLVAPASYTASQTYTAYSDNSVIAIVVGGSNTWQMAIKSFTAGATPPTFSATQATLSSDGNWVSLGNPVSDATNGDFKVACPANTVAAQNLANDLNAWLEQFLSKYVGTYNTEMKAFWPDLLNFGTNFSSNDWGNPTWSGGFKALNQFADVGFWGQVANGNQEATLDPMLPYKENYAFTYFGKPAILEQFETVVAGGNWEGVGCSTSPANMNCWGNLVARGNGFYSQVNEMLHYKAPDGSMRYAGTTWWSDHCNNAATSSAGCLGLLDNLDNRQDGVENVSASVPCDAPLQTTNCGGELSTVPWLGQNEETCSTCIVPGLALWTAASAPIRPTARSRKGIFAGITLTPASPYLGNNNLKEVGEKQDERKCARCPNRRNDDVPSYMPSFLVPQKGKTNAGNGKNEP